MVYNKGCQTVAREPLVALQTFACDSSSFPKNLICFLYFISVAKCINIVKWYSGS